MCIGACRHRHNGSPTEAALTDAMCGHIGRSLFSKHLQTQPLLQVPTPATPSGESLQLSLPLVLKRCQKQSASWDTWMPHMAASGLLLAHFSKP